MEREGGKKGVSLDDARFMNRDTEREREREKVCVWERQREDIKNKRERVKEKHNKTRSPSRHARKQSNPIMTLGEKDNKRSHEILIEN